MSPTKRPCQPTFRVLGEPFDEANELRIAPIAVARRPHDLPIRSGHRQRYGAGEAAGGIVADRARRSAQRLRFAREQFFGRRRRRVRILQRRQRLGIERAGANPVDRRLFLRGDSTRGGEEKESEQPNDSAHLQLFCCSNTAWVIWGRSCVASGPFSLRAYSYHAQFNDDERPANLFGLCVSLKTP
jgi:hypothetical protein